MLMELLTVVNKTRQKLYSPHLIVKKSCCKIVCFLLLLLSVSLSFLSLVVWQQNVSGQVSLVVLSF